MRIVKSRGVFKFSQFFLDFIQCLQMFDLINRITGIICVIETFYRSIEFSQKFPFFSVS